jgi:hypothetical protein
MDILECCENSPRWFVVYSILFNVRRRTSVTPPRLVDESLYSAAWFGTVRFLPEPRKEFRD